jgi:hypothetical protein
MSSQTLIEYLGQPHTGSLQLLIDDRQGYGFIAVGLCFGAGSGPQSKSTYHADF